MEQEPGGFKLQTKAEATKLLVWKPLETPKASKQEHIKPSHQSILVYNWIITYLELEYFGVTTHLLIVYKLPGTSKYQSHILHEQKSWNSESLSWFFIGPFLQIHRVFPPFGEFSWVFSPSSKRPLVHSVQTLGNETNELLGCPMAHMIEKPFKIRLPHLDVPAWKLENGE